MKNAYLKIAQLLNRAAERPTTPSIIPKVPLLSPPHPVSLPRVAPSIASAHHVTQSSSSPKSPWKAFMYPTVNHIYNETTGKRGTIDSLLNSPTRDVSIRALSNKWGLLAQGNNEGVVNQDAIEFISKNNVPKDRDITYAQPTLEK